MRVGVGGKRCGEGLLNTLNFRCKLQIRSSYSYSALSAYPFGHHSRNEYLIPLAEGFPINGVGSVTHRIGVSPNPKCLRQVERDCSEKSNKILFVVNTCRRLKCKERLGFFTRTLTQIVIYIILYYLLFVK